MMRRRFGRVRAASASTCRRGVSFTNHITTAKRVRSRQAVEAVPPPDCGTEVADDQQADAGADRHAHVIEAGANPSRAVGKRSASIDIDVGVRHRFAHADEHARHREAPESARRARNRRQSAPQQQPDRDQARPMHHVREHAHEQPHHDVKGDEERPVSRPNSALVRPQVRHDEVREARQQLAVHEVHHVEQRQEHEKPVVSPLERTVGHLPPPRYRLSCQISR